MIKKLVLFGILLGLGLGVMHFVIGWENFATVRRGDQKSPIQDRDVRSTGFVVGEVEGRESSEVMMATSGRLRLTREKPHTRGDGQPSVLKAYTLIADDSRSHPTEDDRLELFGVTVEFFDLDRERSTPSEPVVRQVGTLTAASGTIQLGRDAKGNPSVLEDRDIELDDVVLATEPAAGVLGIEMRIDRVLVRHRETGVDLRTPTDDVAFEITIDDDDAPMTLTGLGLRASLPADVLPPGTARVLELHIAKRPVFVRGDSTLRASGALDYVEDLDAGIGRVELHDDVIAHGLLRDDARSDSEPASTRNGPIELRGDTVRGTLARRGGPDAPSRERRASWLQLHVLGSPAELEGHGALLRCERIDARPALDGQPSIFSASGGQPTFEAIDSAGRLTQIRADRVHVIRLRVFFGALHRPFGFSDFALGPLAEQLILFEGETTITDVATGDTLRASDGLRVLTGRDDETPTISKSFGAVEIRSDGLVARGSAGFVLGSKTRATSESNGIDGSERLRLGPATPDPTHAFHIERSGQEQPFTAEGHGFVEWRPRGDGSNELRLESPAADIDVHSGGLRMHAVRELTARFEVADERLLGLEALGSPCVIERSDADGTMTGHGDTLTVGRDAAVIALVGAPATIEDAEGSSVRGAMIEVFDLASPSADPTASRVSDRQAVIVSSDAHHRAHAIIDPRAIAARRGTATGVTPGRPEPQDPITVDADRLHFVPWLLPPGIARLHASFGAHVGGWTRVFAASATAPHLLAHGAVHVVQSGVAAADVFGELFVTRLDGSAGVMFGDPARAEHLGDDGRRTQAFGQTLRFGAGQDDAGQLRLVRTTDFDPIVILESAGGLGEGGTRASGSIERLRVISYGDVRADRAAVSFDAPVLAQQLDADGSVTRDGLRVTADHLDVRANESGTLDQLTAEDSVVMSIRGAVVRGDELRVDLARSTATVIARDGLAEVELPDGQIVRGSQLEIDYLHMLVRAWNVRSDSL